MTESSRDTGAVDPATTTEAVQQTVAGGLAEARERLEWMEHMGRYAIWMCEPKDEHIGCCSDQVMGEFDELTAEGLELLGSDRSIQAAPVRSALERIRDLRTAGHTPCTDEDCFAYDHANQIVAICCEVVPSTSGRYSDA
jgi:hypothetical protein